MVFSDGQQVLRSAQWLACSVTILMSNVTAANLATTAFVYSQSAFALRIRTLFFH